MNKNDIDLSNFLAEAKKQTYANKNIKKSPSTRLGSFDYEYSNGKFSYHDTYFGGTKFIGEEDDTIPIRGPKEFINNEYCYTFEVNGDLDCFDGTETIYYKNEKIYILKCHGGIIK